MTLDELTTRYFKLMADFRATQMAQDALMVSLAPEQQEAWLGALRTLAANKASVLAEHVGASTATQAQVDAMGARLEQLDRVRRAFVKNDAAGMQPGEGPSPKRG